MAVEAAFGYPTCGRKIAVKPSSKIRVRNHLYWLRLILLSRKGSVFCHTGLNDIYGINSWVRGWVDGGGDNNYSTCSFLLFVPLNVSLGLHWCLPVCTVTLSRMRPSVELSNNYFKNMTPPVT